MSTAVPERIALELISRMEAITVANGYAFSAADVYRVNRDATSWTPANYAIVVVQGDAERNFDHDRPGNPVANAYELTFVVVGFVRQSDRTTAADQAKMNDMDAAIRKAIANGTSWHVFDDATYDAELEAGANVVQEDGDYSAVTIELKVRYRVSEVDPYTVRT